MRSLVLASARRFIERYESDARLPVAPVLQRWSCDNQWKQRREELRAKQRATDAGSTSPDPALVDVLPENLSLFEAQVEYENHTKATALRIARIIKRTPDAQLIASADK